MSRANKRKKGREDAAPVQIDIYGVKLPAGKTDAETRPETWAEVARRANRHLMTLVERFAALGANAMVAANYVVTAIGNSFVRRNAESHHQAADRAEDARQAELEERPGQSLSWPDSAAAERSLEALKDLLHEFQAKGLAVEIRDLGNGRVGLFLLPPESMETAEALVHEELRRLPAPPPQDQAGEPIAALGLSPRVADALAKGGIRSVEQLTCSTTDDLRALPGIGLKALVEIRARLADRGLTLTGE
jgi:hypothetical protein